MLSTARGSAAPIGDLFRIFELSGVFANAAVGAKMAQKERLDFLGVLVIAVISGLGGGIICDVLLQRGTPVFLTDYAYLLTAFGSSLVVYVVSFRGLPWKFLWPLVDAAALGSWAAAGAEETLSVGLGWLAAVLLGTITAVGGGAIRDVVLRRVPTILGGNDLYATCALAASVSTVSLYETGHPVIALVAGASAGAALRLLARWRRWQLPLGEGRLLSRRRPP